MAARSFAYHAHETADHGRRCYPWLVCHDIKSAMHCSLRLAPTMINHLTSLALFPDIVERMEEVLGLHVPYEVTYPHTLGPRGVLITKRFGQVKQYYLYTKQNTFHLLYKTEYFPFSIQNRILSIYCTKHNTFYLAPVVGVCSSGLPMRSLVSLVPRPSLHGSSCWCL